MISTLKKLKPWLVPGLIIAAGAFLRFRSAWLSDIDIDEAWRALIISHAAGHITTPVVPPMSLALPSLAISVLGNTEIVLRLPGLACALGSLLLIFLITRNLAGRTAAVLALFVLAFQPEIIQYDSTLKQYAYEVFFVLALIYLAERVLSRGSPRDRALFAVVAVGGIFFATPLIHIYPALFIVLLWREWRTTKRFPIYAFGVACAALAASIADYLVFLKVPDYSGLNAYWQDGFIALRPVLAAFGRLADLSFEFFRWFVYHRFGALGDALLLPGSGLFLALAGIGCARMIRERKLRFAAYAISPLFILAAYSFARLWPFGAVRVNLFYSPLLIIAAAVGGAFLWERLWAAGRRPARIAAVLAAAVLFVGFLPVRRYREFVYGRNELKAPIERILAHYLPGDAILTRDTTHRIVIYYTRLYAPNRKLGKTVDIHDVYHPWEGFMGRRRFRVEEIEAGVREQFRTHDRIWLVFKWDLRNREEEAAILRAARDSGRERWGIQRSFCKVALFEPDRDPRP